MRSHRPPRRGLASSRPPPLLSLLAVSSLFVSYTSAITLDQFQQIAQFPAVCANAYLADIPGCQQSDFFPPDAPCSQSCFDGLNALTMSINTACRGIQADPTTLIGLFFEAKGTAALCPTVNKDLNPAPVPDPQQASTPTAPDATDAPTSVSETFIMTSMSGAQATDTANGGGNFTPVSPMSATDGVNSASVAMAGTQTAVKPVAATTTGGGGGGGSNGNGDASTFGGGAIPFGVSQPAQGAGAANSISAAGAISLWGVLVAALIL